MKKIEIIKDVEFEDDGKYERSLAGKKPEWPIGNLEVGDGFFVELEDKNKVRCSIQHFQKWYPGKKFQTKTQEGKILVKRVS